MLVNLSTEQGEAHVDKPDLLSLRATEDTRVAGSAAISYAKSAEELRSPRPRETRGLAMTQTPTSSTDPKWWATGLKIRLDG